MTHIAAPQPLLPCPQYETLLQIEYMRTPTLVPLVTCAAQNAKIPEIQSAASGRRLQVRRDS